MQPYCTSCWIWVGSPPDVALLMAQAASLFISSSPFFSRFTIGSMQPLSITADICSFVPAKDTPRSLVLVPIRSSEMQGTRQ